jgi:hypothetical protein
MKYNHVLSYDELVKGRTMNDNLNVFLKSDIKDKVQDMRELFSQNKIAFLFGAGCSKCAGLPLMGELTKEVLNHKSISNSSKKLLDNVLDLFSGACYATIEDYMSEIVDQLSIAERRNRRGAKQKKVFIKDLEIDATELQVVLDEIKQAVSFSIGNKQVNIATHQQFIRVIHTSLQAGKGDRGVDYFILNYDTLIEDALGLECVVYNDGFTGGATGWWQPDSFRYDGKATNVFKMHGSIDWCLLKDDSLPRRIRSGIKTEFIENHVLIYPAATKYQETQRDPFAQMLYHLRTILCPCEGKEIVLVICGYSFGDSHINLEIFNALSKSDGRLTIAAFVETEEPEGELSYWMDNSKINDQIRVYTNKGFFMVISNLNKKMTCPGGNLRF